MSDVHFEAPKLRQNQKAWDELTYERKLKIKGEFRRNFRCPQCAGQMFFVGGTNVDDERTIVEHEPWCVIPVVRWLIAMGRMNAMGRMKIGSKILETAQSAVQS